MKTTIFLALALAAGTATAGLQRVQSTGPHDPTVGMMDVGMTCQQVGNFTYCNDTTTRERITCQQVGQFTYCN